MAKIYSLDGKVKGDVNLPKVFSTQYRPDLIQKSVIVANANSRGTYAVDSRAGLKTSGDYFGSRRHSYRQTINRGNTRLPRVKTGGGGLGRVVRIPQAKGGRKAHAPIGKDYSLKMNKKEYLFALNSAIAATTNKDLVASRGHKYDGDLPIIIEDKLEGIQKTQDFLVFAKTLGFEEELGTAKKKKMLIVVSQDNGIRAAASNVFGVDVATVNDLDVDLLAPGTHPGRLTLWSESAIKDLS